MDGKQDRGLRKPGFLLPKPGKEGGRAAGPAPLPGVWKSQSGDLLRDRAAFYGTGGLGDSGVLVRGGPWKRPAGHSRRIRQGGLPRLSLIHISKDGTLNRLKELAAEDGRVTYLSFSRNFGKEAAMYAGLCNARGDYAAIMDADMQDPPSLLPEMFRLMEQGYEMCIRDSHGGVGDGEEVRHQCIRGGADF